MRRLILLFFFLVLALVFFTSTDLTRAFLRSGMPTIYVSRSGSIGKQDGSSLHPFDSISKAIAVAAKNAHIHVAAGSYHENLRIKRPVNLHGASSGTTVIIGSLSEASIIRFEASGSVDNVTLIPDKSQAGNADVEMPIGIAIRKGAKTVEVNFCTIDSCSVGVETAVCDASVMINGTTLIRNHYGIGAVLTTGTVYCANSQITDNFTGVFTSEADLHLFSCTVVNNRHGVHVGTRYKNDKDTRIILEGNKIENNLVTGLWFDQGTPDLRTMVDLGGGGWSGGKNEIGENQVYDIYNDSKGGRISALNNVFGTRRFVNSDASSRVDIGDGDTEPPVLKVEISPQTIGPADRRMVPIHASLSATDNSGVAPLILLSSIGSDQPQSNMDIDDIPIDVQEEDYRSADTDFKLRAEISQGKAKRTYVVTYVATDASGNSSACSAAIDVVR